MPIYQLDKPEEVVKYLQSLPKDYARQWLKRFDKQKPIEFMLSVREILKGEL